MNVLFIIFNRPKLTALVFEQIRKARPEKLFIAGDGPRADRPGEEKLCEESRDIIKMIDWPCNVKTNLQSKNLGCKMHVSGAISWFFENIEEGVILEDDCLPVPSFFTFCEDMLNKYRLEENIMHISGTNFLVKNEISDPSSDYRFSRCVHIWGWATWKRAWEKYDIDMKSLGSAEYLEKTRGMFLKKKYINFWTRHCEHIDEKNIDTWDAQWQYSILYNNGIAISPNANIIENIGFGFGATHTSSKERYILPVSRIDMPIRDPKAISVDMMADENLMEKVYVRNLWKRISSRLLSNS